MRSNVIECHMQQFQLEIYQEHRHFSINHQFLGRLLALPVAMIDVGADLLTPLFAAIERLAFVAINFFGAAFSAKCTIKDAIWSLEAAYVNTVQVPFKILLIPIKLLFQVSIILINPVQYRPINLRIATFKGETIVHYTHQIPQHLQVSQNRDYKKI